MLYSRQLHDLLIDSVEITNSQQARTFEAKAIIDEIEREGDAEDVEAISDIMSNVMRRFPPEIDRKLVV